MEELIQYANEKHEMHDWHNEDAEDHISLVVVDDMDMMVYSIDPDTGEILGDDE